MEQVSTLRQAIIALKNAEGETESLPRKGVYEIDLGQPLYSVVLSKLDDSYYERNKIFHPSMVDPCDTMVSRLARELEKRHLTLRAVWDTRTQEFQRKQSAKRPKIGTSGDTSAQGVHDQPREEVVETTLAAYLFKHVTLTVAYGKAGSVPITPPSGSLPREVRGSDTAQYVPVPFDIVFWRTTSGSSQQPRNCLPLWRWNGLRARASRNEVSGSNDSRIPPCHLVQSSSASGMEPAREVHHYQQHLHQTRQQEQPW